MRVIFLAHDPGNHHEILETHMDVVPRVGDEVWVDQNTFCRTVHSVTWDLMMKPIAAKVLLQ